jgi:hypothetical protein
MSNMGRIRISERPQNTTVPTADRARGRSSATAGF